ncbi:cache domain-containing protein, partial [Nautilia sp.]
MIESLKKKILKYNNFSIFILLFFLAVSTYTLTYCIMHEKLNEEIKNIKTTYINNQKMLMKNQINNLINFIKTIKNDKMKEMLYELKKTNFLLSDIINKLPANGWKTVLNEYSETYPLIHITLSDINANPLFTHLKDYNKTKRLKLIKKLLLKHKNDIFFVHKTSLGKKITFQHLIDGKYLLTTCLYQKEIDDIIKKTVIKVISNIRFGAKNNGYISIAEILNYKGGKRFAKVVALPVKPAMVGKFLDDDKKDAKGKEYRKQYLKIANTTGEGFVEYYFYKYSDKITRPKISYVKLYKPFNWLIFTSVFLDDINEIIDKKIIIFNREIKKIFVLYTILFLIIILIAVLITRYENKILKEIIDQYEKQINYQNIQLKSQNINLQHEVHKKTKQLIENMFKDSLTNLPNREKLLNDIKDNYIAIINIDDFKEINDFFGIKEGDRIIREFARFLNKITPTYKLSGDEYAVIGKTPAKLKH